jgi:D-alanyl-D-alanine carboxypeptidase/D-alanyl-D-alanine-endopeptidase (penicillin-binding protein 4)
LRRIAAGFAAILALALSACHPTPRPSLGASGHNAVSATARLQQDLHAIVSTPALERSYWAVAVKALDSGEMLYALNAHKLLMPASALKIVTLAAAAQTLGWNFSYETRLLATGSIRESMLDGDLLVVGSGDPTIVERDGMSARLFDDWANQLKSAGITAIAGRIVGDDRAFDDEPFGFGWSWDDLDDGFAAGVSALQYNENRAQVTIAPGTSVGRPATVTVAPSGTGLIVSSAVTTVASGGAIHPRRLPGSDRIELRGSIRAGAEPAVLSVSVDNPARFFVTALREALIARGITVRGPAVAVRELSDAPAHDDARVVVTHRSAPLSALMTLPFKFSLNLHEETLLKTIGASMGMPTFAAGLAATRSILRGWGVPAAEVIQVDGSGLSRYNYITADALTTVLTRIDRDEVLCGPFEAALPVAGRDGTVAARLKGTAAEGNARVKTGSMSNVRAEAGFVTDADGERLAFAVLANNFETPQEVNRAMDAIVVRLAEFSRR